MASTYLSRTLSASPTNQKIITYSFWAKRSNLGIYAYNLVGNTSAPYVTIGFLNDDTFAFLVNAGAGGTGLITTAKYRDVSAWYHIVCVLDTTQATDSNRMKIYINGVQITDFGTASYPAQDSTWNINTNVEHGVGGSSVIQDFDGYMAEVYFIDGQALSPTDFGQTDSTGIWKPKGYSGSYGTNGFNLKFSNSGDLGADSSGNGNNFTKSGNGRQTTDAPSNVFPTINALCRTNTNHVLSNGNLTHQVTSAWMYLPANMGASSGKWYAEMKIDAVTNNFNCGVMELSGIASDWMNNMNNPNTVFGSNTQGDAWALYGNGSDTGTYKNNNTPNFGNISTSFGSNILVGDIINIALDCDNQKIWFGVNGSWDNSGDPAAGTNPMPYNTAMIAGRTYAFASGPEYATQSWNFGNPPYTVSSGNADGNGYGNFEYAPPTGFLAMCTKNLATELAPTIDDGSEYMNTVLYTGTGSSTSITGVGFQPDFVWIKKRSATAYHYLMDSTRGTGKQLYSNITNAEETNANALTSYDSDGFSLGSETDVNATSTTFVGWNWKANGGTTSSNSDGTITSTVQADTTAGFSIVSYTGTGSNATVGHGLGVVPDMVIVKNRSSSADWGVQMVNTLGFTNALRLNLYDAYGGVNGAGWWNDIAPTSTTVSIGTRSEVNTNGNNYIMYCFNNVEGYSKFGKYVGTGNANGQFVYTGFRPAFVIIKRTDSSGVWTLIDTTRQNYNLDDRRVHPNLADAEYSGDGYGWDMLSNGFKQRSTSLEFNGDGASFIYMAFAENPFVTSGGLPVTAR